MSNLDEWRDKAVCKGKDTDSFYPEGSSAYSLKSLISIKAMCNVCPVAVECLHDAITHEEEFGIWGGLSPRERGKIVKKFGIPSKSTLSFIIKKGVKNI